MAETRTRTFEVLEKVPRTYRIVIIFLLNVLILYGGYNFLLRPKFETEKSLLKEMTELDAKVKRLVEIKNNIEKFRAEYVSLKNAFEEAIKQLPETKDVPNLLRNVSNLCAETRLRVKSFEPKQGQQKEFYIEFPFEIKFSAPYHNVGYFFDGIRREKRIIHVVDFSLETKSPGTQVQSLEGYCLAKTYVYSPKKPSEVKKEEKVEKK